MKILHIDSSARSAAQSTSRALTRRLVAHLGGDITYRDLGVTHPPLLTAAMVQSYFADPAKRDPEQEAQIVQSDTLVAELMASDVLVIGMPIYNFGPPAALKAWADQVARTGVTFQFEGPNPIGLVPNTKAIVVVTSGGIPMHHPEDLATPWVKAFLRFIGITDIAFIDASGQALNAEAALDRAYAEIDAL